MCFLYLGIHTKWYFRSYTVCFVLLIPTPQLYREKPYLGKHPCLALRRATFLPPASWRVSSGVFYDMTQQLIYENLSVQISKYDYLMSEYANDTIGNKAIYVKRETPS